MKRLHLLLCMWLCLQMAPGALQAGTMGLLGYRWRNDEISAWKVGHTQVPDQNKGEIVSACASQYYAWWNLLSGSQLNFTFYDDGDRYYNVSDPQNAIWWEQMPSGECALAHSRIELEPLSMDMRIRKVHIQFTTRLDASNQCTGYPEFYGDYCWYHCPAPGPSACSPQKTYDWSSTLAHEFGHAVVGLGHYTPCNFTESIMWPAADNDCALHRDPGTVDASLAAWTLRDLMNDAHEPENDLMTDAPPLGSGILGSPWDQASLIGALPGYADLDCWRFDVTGAQPGLGMRLEVVIICYDPTMRLKARIYQSGNPLVDLEATTPGEDLRYDCLAENSPYHVCVTSRQGRGGEQGADYGVVAQLYWPVADVPVMEEAGPRIAVLHHRQEVRGVGDGRLELFDAAGRRVDSEEVRGAWVRSYASLRLGSGVYFLRCTTNDGSTRSKLVVVR